MSSRNKHKRKRHSEQPIQQLRRHAKKLGMRIVQADGINSQTIEEAIVMLEGARRSLPRKTGMTAFSTNRQCTITLITRNRA